MRVATKNRERSAPSRCCPASGLQGCIVGFRDSMSRCGEMSLRIFVYGTLKRGQGNHPLLAGQGFVGSGLTEPRYRLHDLGGFPGMVPDSDRGRSIVGEVWDVDEPCLRRLDELEDVAGGEYERTAIRLLPPFSDQRVEGYLYLRPVAGFRDAGSSWP